MSHSEVRARLAKAVNDHGYESGKWANYVDHTGDGESGDCIYNCADPKLHGSDMKSAPYSTSQVNGKTTTRIDHEKAKLVHPSVSYKEIPDDADNYASMESARLYTEMDTLGLPLFERFISKDERAGMDPGDFAGKGTSFPIKNQTDVDAAMHAIGRAGPGNYSAATIKANIRRIAASKGLKVPGDGGSGGRESAAPIQGGDLHLVESATTMEPIVLREARADYEIKLIAPGKGVTAFYPADVLKRDGAAAFPVETKVYLNHPVGAEEAEAPGNRDVTRFAGVLTKAAEWKENGSKGPGLYSRFKVFADHAEALQDKAPYLAMSIMANGRAVMEGGNPVQKDGVPLLAALTRGDSVDIVPMAGAGGMILTEAARPANPIQEVDVDQAAFAKLQESNRKLAQRLAKTEAREAGTLQLNTVRLPEETKSVILARCVESAPITVDGDFDGESFKKLVEREIKFAGELLGGGQIVTDMGAPEAAQLTEVQRADIEKSNKRQSKLTAAAFGIGTKQGARIFREGRSAFDPNYNSKDKRTVSLDTLEAVS